MGPKILAGLIRDAFHEWTEDKVPQLGAALAFYSLLSLAPLLLIAIAIAGLIFGAEAAQGQLVDQLRELVGVEGARAIEAMIANARKPGAGAFATVVGLVTLLCGASGVFGQLQDALNTIWEVKPKPGLGVWGFIRGRFLSFSMVLGTGFLLLVSLVVSTALAAAGKYFGGLLPEWASILQVVNFAVSFGVITLLFAMIFKYLPDAKIAWGDVWLGSVATASLFMVGKFAIGLYLGSSGIGSAYGAAGSLVVLLVWIYYSAQILFFGAEFTQVYANRRGSRIVPSRNAERVTERDRDEQGLPHAGAPKPKPDPRAAVARSRDDAEILLPGRVDFPGRSDRLPAAASVKAKSPTRPGKGPRMSSLELGTVAAAIASLIFLSARDYLADKQD